MIEPIHTDAFLIDEDKEAGVSLYGEIRGTKYFYTIINNDISDGDGTRSSVIKTWQSVENLSEMSPEEVKSSGTYKIYNQVVSNIKALKAFAKDRALEGEEEVVIWKNKNYYLTREAEYYNPSTNRHDLYNYRVYSSFDDELIGEFTDSKAWTGSESGFKSSSVFKECLKLIADDEATWFGGSDPYQSPFLGSFYKKKTPEEIEAEEKAWKEYREKRQKEQEELVKKYSTNDTLCIHKSDPTTTMLEQIYRGRGWDVINDVYSIDDETLHKILDNHKRIVMLGHGSAYGLSGSIRDCCAEHLVGKKLFALWCNADAFCERHPDLGKGFFACGNMPSDEHEAAWVGYKVSHQYMDDNITYWCKLCGDVVEQCLEGDAKAGCEYIRDKYWEKYGKSSDPDEIGITVYNYQRTKTAGESLIEAPIKDFKPSYK